MTDIAGTIDIVSDAICPWCWIGKRHLEAALEELAAEGLHFAVRWRPFQLNPDMPREGVPREAYRAAKFGSLERSRQLDAQVADAGRSVGLGFRHDLMARTPNTVAAHALIRTAGEAGCQDAVVEALFQAYFAEGRDIGDLAVLAGIAAKAGLDPADAAAQEAAVIAEDADARQGGISGVPSFLMERYLLFSGAMPGPRMAQAFRHARRVLADERA
jgi:predicted DsbA family dithiol-disulfide isomerase